MSGDLLASGGYKLACSLARLHWLAQTPPRWLHGRVWHQNGGGAECHFNVADGALPGAM